MRLFRRKKANSDVAAALLEGYARAYRVFQPQIDELREKVQELAKQNQRLSLQLNEVCDVAQRLKVKQNKEEEKKAKEEEEEEEVYEEVQEEEEVEDDEEWEEEEEEEDEELEEDDEDEEEVEDDEEWEEEEEEEDEELEEDEENEEEVEEEEEEVDEKEKEEVENVREEAKENQEQKERVEGMDKEDRNCDVRGAQTFRPEMDTSVSGWPCFVIPGASAILASDDEDMSPEDMEVAEILKHLPPIVPTRRELPKSWLFESHTPL